MSHDLKNKNLIQRAQLLRKIREFFAAKGVLEVETPLLCRAPVTDPHLDAITASVNIAGKTQTFYLQTSPEYAMKRLLVENIGSIYQICKAFRNEESGAYHNPEFTMLEWYRVNFDHLQLMDEMDEFLQHVLLAPQAQRLTYAEAFQQFLQLNPHTATIAELQNCISPETKVYGMENATKDQWLDYGMSHLIEPKLGFNQPIFIYDYPASQAALAKIRDDTYRVAERFEVYIQGIELANGYHELLDAPEHLQRFTADLAYRTQAKLPIVPMDMRFIDALERGLPNCAGVALGVDRLLMLAVGAKRIEEVVSFITEKT